MTVGRHVIPRRLGHLLYAAVFMLIVGCGFSASAQQPADELVPAKLNCGSHSANSKELKPFQFDLQFEVFGSLWMVDRATSHQPAAWHGKISRDSVSIRNHVGCRTG
jgi:hypothetical protein